MSLAGSSATPRGSARFIDIRFHRKEMQATFRDNYLERGGTPHLGGMETSSTNWGTLGTTGNDTVTYKGVKCMQYRGGSTSLDMYIPYWYDPANPFAAKFNWPIGYYALEALMAWPTDSANVDNGMWWGLDGFTRVVTQTGRGVMVWNNNGQLTWTMRGMITENVAINTGVSIREWQKIRLEWIWPSSKAAPVLQLVVNDVIALARTVGQIPSGPGLITQGFGTFDSVNFVYFTDVHMIAGPLESGTA